MGVVLCVCMCVHAFKEQETIVYDMRKSGKESEMSEHSTGVLSATLNVSQKDSCDQDMPCTGYNCLMTTC